MGTRESPLGLTGNGGYLTVHIEDFTFIHSQCLYNVLVGMGVQSFFESLPQQILSTFRVGDMTVDSQHQIVRNQRIRRRKEPQVAHYDSSFVFG